MARSRRDPSPAAPVSVSGAAAAERQRFHRQSYDKSVGQVGTLFGCEPMAVIGPDAVPAENRWCGALAGSSPGRPLDPVPEAGAPGYSGALDERLLAAGLEALKVRRIASIDRYVLHRAYPSPRGMFGVDAHLDSSAGIRRLEPWGPYTTELCGPGRSGAGGSSVLRLHTRPERFPAPYGTLRPSLALLEAGHLLATIGAAAFQSGLAAETGFGAFPGDPTAGTGAVAGWVAHAAAGPAAVIGPAAHARLVRLASGYWRSEATVPRDFEQWLDQRSSGSSHANLVTSGSIPESVEAGTDAVVGAALAAAAHLLPGANALLVHKVRLEGNNMASKTATEIGPGDSIGKPVAWGSHADTPFSSALGYCWSVDFVAWEHRYGPGAATVLHALLGWLCQWVCLSAAASGATARPARNFDEADWGQALRLGPGHVPGYQVWLRPAPLDDHVPGSWTTYGRKARP